MIMMLLYTAWYYSGTSLQMHILIFSLLSFFLSCRFVGKSILTIESYEEWKDRRKNYDPSFSRRSACSWLYYYYDRIIIIRSLDDLIPQFNKVINKYLVKNLKDSIDSGKTIVDMKSLFSKVTLEVISWVRQSIHIVTISSSTCILLLRLHLEWTFMKMNMSGSCVDHKIYCHWWIYHWKEWIYNFAIRYYLLVIIIL